MRCNKNDSLCQQAASAFSCEMLASYIAMRRGEVARPTKCGAEWQVGNKVGCNSTHVRMRDGKAVATDFAGDGREKDAIDWVQELEGIADVGDAARRAAEVAGLRLDASSSSSVAPVAAPQETADPIPQPMLATLAAGCDCESFRAWCALRGIDCDTVRRVGGVGYVPADGREMVWGKLWVTPHSVCFFSPDGTWAKAIPLGADGYRDKGKARHSTTHGQGQWQPIQPAAAAPTILVEGETAALAILSCGIQAIPCKAQGEAVGRIGDMMARGCRLYYGYDYDNGGQKLLETARKHFPQIPDISGLWKTGTKPDGTPDPDPAGFVRQTGNRDAVRMAVAAAIQAADAAMPRPPQPQPQAQPNDAPEKKKKPKPRDVCDAYFNDWKYDEFYCECVAPDGMRYSEDQAEALAYDATGADVTSIRNAIKNKVKYAIGKQINGLYEHVLRLGETCTDADRGAIDRFCERMRFDAYESRRVRLWLYQVVARAAIPGEKTDGMLVIVSHEGGLQKTKLFNAVSSAMTNGRKGAQPFAFRGNKDELLSLATNCVVIVDEIDKIFKKKDVSDLKATITLEGADIRDPYARSARPRKFCAVFGATSNDLNPIPTGEGDARRYWVVQPTIPMEITTKECESMMREAANDVLTALEAHALEYDRNTTVGKIWVESVEEYKETVARNNGRKASSTASIAVECAARYVQSLPDAPWKDAPTSAAALASCVETGNLEHMRIPAAQGTWSHTICNSSEVSRLIGQRIGHKRKTARVFGVGIRSGYTWRDIIAEFLPDESGNDDPQTQFSDIPTDYGTGYDSYRGW